MTDESLFAAALALPVADRHAYLAANCSDPVVRGQVEELLAAAGASNLLDAPPADVEQTIPRVQTPPEPSASVGDRVGPYKLLEKIGEGGMGEVWVADQTEPIKRRVALKLIKPGMDSRSVLGRFEAERQALAVMDHPNIARVLDAGTTADGRPYFVMELVKGTPITEFADARKLTPRQRLELFVPVCQAIQHAHMKGIIHRDIKPGNVLVALHDETAVPKVIDFGVAKAVGQQLTERTIYTGFGALVGTPTYMAPEQATFNQLDVDTRADVYALGVLLYELLAGSPPIEKERLKKAALDEVLRMVREEEPLRPSQRLSTADTRASIAAVRSTEPEKLSQQMKGELDWIVMKALEKDRTRRYDSANGFAADVQRYLNGEPVQAVPPSLGYRLRKFWRKNRTVITTVLLVAVMLKTVTLFSIWLASRAMIAEEQAKTDRDTAVNAQGEAATSAEVARTEAERVREEQAHIRRLLYASEMARGSLALADGRTEQVLHALAETAPKPGEPDLRGWEWHYLNRLYTPPLTEVHLGLPSDDRSDTAMVVGQRSVATRDDAGGGIWFEVYDTASGKQVGRVPKEGTLQLKVGKVDRQLVWGGPVESRRTLPPGVLDAAGKFLAAWEFEPEKDGQPRAHLRLWRTDTGEELDGPPVGPPGSGVVVGPDAAWVAWVGVRGIGFASGPNGPPLTSKPVEFSRWERTTKTLARQTIATTGQSAFAKITADGRSLLVTQYVPAGEQNTPDTPRIDLQSWDITADSPKPRFPAAIRIPDSVKAQHTISPAGKVLAVWGEREVVVYNLADGSVRWRYTLGRNSPRLTSDGTAVGSSGVSLKGVSDDGLRVVFRAPDKVTVLEHPPRFGLCREWSYRYAPLTGSLSVVGPALPGWRPYFQNASNSHTWPDGTNSVVSADGKTLYIGFGKDQFRIALFDLTTDPLWEGPVSRPQRVVEYRGAGDGQPAGHAILDAGGREVGRVRGSRLTECTLIANRWVLFNLPGANRNGGLTPTGERLFASRWDLYDSGDPKGLRWLAGDVGRAHPTDDDKWVISDDVAGYTPNRFPNGGGGAAVGSRFVYADHWTTTTVYRVADGERMGEVKAPPGSVLVGDRPSADGERLAVFTHAAPKEGEAPQFAEKGLEWKQRNQWTLTARLFDLRTGQQEWEAETSKGERGGSYVLFPQDGKRVIAAVWDGRRTHVHVFSKADGREERRFDVTDGFLLHPLEETPDGHLLFSSNGEMEVWNPDTGRRTHRLTGHTNATELAFDSSGRRLFVLDQTSDPNASARGRIAVWDLATDREVLSVPVDEFGLGNIDWQALPRFDFAGGKLRYSTPEGLRVLDGTPIPEPKK